MFEDADLRSTVVDDAFTAEVSQLSRDDKIRRVYARLHHLSAKDVEDRDPNALERILNSRFGHMVALRKVLRYDITADI